MENKTLKEILNQVNEILKKKLIGKKLSYREIHSIVAEIIKRNIELSYYYAWYLEINDIEVAELEIEGIDDKHFKNKRVAKIVDIYFKPKKEEYLDKTIQEIKKIEMKESLLQTYNNAIREAQEDLDSIKSNLEYLKEYKKQDDDLVNIYNNNIATFKEKIISLLGTL